MIYVKHRQEMEPVIQGKKRKGFVSQKLKSLIKFSIYFTFFLKTYLVKIIYSSDECEERGGEPDGECALGYGVCCICKLSKNFFSRRVGSNK